MPKKPLSFNLEVSEGECACFVYFPNAFSPDANGINDEFHPVFDCSFDRYELMIFNRWGNLIFRSQDPHEKWNGKVNGNPSPLGVYAYTLRYSNAFHPNNRMTGSVTLIR